MAISFKGAHFPKEVILMGVRWYVAYPLSTRHVEELMEERGSRSITPLLTGGSSNIARC
jgi:transposase-like protein